MIYYENFLPNSLYQRLFNLIDTNEFPWFLNKSTLNGYDHFGTLHKGSNITDTTQFTHTFFTNGNNSSLWDIVYPVIYSLSEITNVNYDVIRCKVNLLLKEETYKKDYYHPPHIDFLDYNNQYKSLIVYLNDSDGDTYLFNETGQEIIPETFTVQKRITPKSNCALFFNSSQYHASSPPIKNNYRMVINFVLKEV
jgi:hypothetical protein